MLGNEAHSYFSTVLVWETQEGKKNPSTSKKCSDYYPFGKVMPTRSNNTTNPNDNYKFTGHERDDEAGLTIDYMMARNYDPVIGRFLRVDPLSDQYPMMNPYNYALNNPLRIVDRTGLCPEGHTGPYPGYGYCMPSITVTARRIGVFTGFVRRGNHIIFDSSMEGGKKGIFDFFYQNPGAVPSFIANNDFSVEARLIAQRAENTLSGEIFWTYAYHGTVNGVTIVSSLSGLGAIYNGVRSLVTHTSKEVTKSVTTNLAKQASLSLNNIALKSSISEVGLRTVGVANGIDSKTNLALATFGASSSAILPATLRNSIYLDAGGKFQIHGIAGFISHKEANKLLLIKAAQMGGISGITLPPAGLGLYGVFY